MERIATSLTMSVFVFCFILVKQVICVCVDRFVQSKTFNDLSH